MPNPVNVDGLTVLILAMFLSITTLLQPLKQPPLKGKTRAANNKAMVYQAHNFADELYDEEDDNKSI